MTNYDVSDYDDGEDKLGGKFWLGVAGLAVGAVCVALLILIIFGAFWSRWGLLGAFIAFFIVLLGIGWMWDRHEKKRRAGYSTE